jgi:sugar lactone lactonase YvrE
MASETVVPRRVQQVQLPHVGETPPSLLHTVLMDETGAIYYSDEFNNSVVSLDKVGRLRWCKNASKCEDSGFFYPRGMSLGRICIDGDSRPCLAVCDSWKHRVRVLDLDGNSLAVWARGSGDPFSEVTDVRYLRTGSHSTAGYWLILDKGNHRVCAIGQDGQPLFEVGSGLSPGLTQRWVVPGIAREEDLPAGFLRDFPPFDFLYYPVRIFGNCEEALYVWEPSSQSLKQLLRGNFFPILLGSVESPLSWIGADPSGFLGFEPESRRILLLDWAGKLRHAISIEGVPVASNLPLNQFWTQTDDRLDCWDCGELAWVEGNGALRTQGVVCSPLLGTAMRQMTLTDSDNEAVKGITSTIGLALSLGDEFIDSIEDADAAPQAVYQGHQTLSQLAQERSRIIESFHASTQHWCVGLLEAALLIGERASEDVKNQYQRALNTWKNLLAPIQAQFAEVQQRLDRVARVRWRIWKARPGEHELLQALNDSLKRLEDDLLGVKGWIQRWCGVPAAPNWVLALSQAPGSDEVGSLLSWPRAQRYAAVSSHLREVAQFTVSQNAGQPLVKPRSLVLMSDGHLLISLSQGHRIVRMDETGKLVGGIGKPGSREGELLGPTGLALDEQNRLWVSEFQNNRIQVFSLDGECLQIFDPSKNGLGPLNGPVGLLAQPGGMVLAADYRNHRVLRVSTDGIFSLFADGVGTGPVENWYPISFAVGRKGNFWLVDQGNHRIKEMRLDGSVVQIVGGCGLEKGRLYLPITAAAFGDGILVVAQAQPSNYLKLLSASGDEVGSLALAYHPAAMLVCGGRLYVAGYDDDAIHIYERL